VDAVPAKSYQPCRMVRLQLHRLLPALRDHGFWRGEARKLLAAADRCDQGERTERLRSLGLRAFRVLEDIGRLTRNPRPRGHVATSRPVARLRTRRGLRLSCRQHRSPVRRAETSRQDNGSSDDGDPGPDAAGRLADALDFRPVVIAFAPVGGIRGAAMLGLYGGGLGRAWGKRVRQDRGRMNTGD
jgi:hypothetical protein